MLTLWIQLCVPFSSKVNCITALQNWYHFCFLYALLLTLSHGNLLIHWRQKITMYYFILLLCVHRQHLWHMLFRNYISQKEFLSFSVSGHLWPWQRFSFFSKRNKYGKISTTTQWRYSGFTFLYYRINSTQRFYNQQHSHWKLLMHHDDLADCSLCFTAFHTTLTFCTSSIYDLISKYLSNWKLIYCTVF